MPPFFEPAHTVLHDYYIEEEDNMAIQIGCDPEFLLMNGSCRVNVDSALNRTTSYGEIGSDHGCRVGELRPKHGHPKDVTVNIRELVLKLKNAVSQNQNYRNTSVKMVAGGGGEITSESIGGHIHISGLNFSVSNFNSYRCKQNQMSTNEDRLILALDFFIGRRLKRVPGGKRASSSYGQPSDVRSQDWGIEYRTPPSWLSEPKLTESTLALAYLIAKIWSVKPIAFDELLTSRKMARRMDYAKLVPEDGPDHEYFTTQINNFKNIIFDKSYNMSNINCFESWESANVTAVTSSMKRAIELKICQVKVVESLNGGMESEIVSKICQFVTPELKVFITESVYAPYSLRHTKRSALRSNTIYISKELRSYLKIRRELGIHVRFIDFIDRDRVHIPNAFMFTKNGAKTNLFNVVEKIVTECVRKKMRRGDE